MSRGLEGRCLPKSGRAQCQRLSDLHSLRRTSSPKKGHRDWVTRQSNSPDAHARMGQRGCMFVRAAGHTYGRSQPMKTRPSRNVWSRQDVQHVCFAKTASNQTSVVLPKFFSFVTVLVRFDFRTFHTVVHQGLGSVGQCYVSCKCPKHPEKQSCGEKRVCAACKSKTKHWDQTRKNQFKREKDLIQTAKTIQKR